VYLLKLPALPPSPSLQPGNMKGFGDAHPGRIQWLAPRDLLISEVSEPQTDKPRLSGI